MSPKRKNGSRKTPFIYFISQDFGIDDLTKERVFIDGWKFQGGIGLFDSYVSALASSMGLWEEYCEYHRTRKI